MVDKQTDTKPSDEMTRAAKWLVELDVSKHADREWIERGKRIVKRFRDERSVADVNLARFNILWSNIETIFPAIYSRTPKAEVSRRNRDSDPVARTAAMIIERALQYEIDQYSDFEDSVKLAVMDRLLPGRGVVWVRFDQHEVSRPDDDVVIDVEAQEIQPDAMMLEQLGIMGAQDQTMMQDQGDIGNPMFDVDMLGDPNAVLQRPDFGMLEPVAPMVPEIKEHSWVDYVYWEDFRHGQARIWADVPWIARREYLTKEEGTERFGDKFAQVPFKHEPVGLEEETKRTGAADEMCKAAVWEIWDKRNKRVVWLVEGFEGILDERDDPYGLEGFFPIPKPLFATMTSDQLIPVPDYSLYQDQARELDLLTSRISGLIQTLRLNGAYDSGTPELARILSSDDNTLIPVSNWATLSEKGGIGGSMEWVPIRDVVGALSAAYQARDQVKQVIYEITGISDILRGATEASETATAQNLKRQSGSLRLQTRQREIAMFVTEILRIKAELMMDIYSPETLLAMSGIMDTDDAKYVDPAIELLQSEPLREYQISVAADSLVAIDEEQEKASRMEFIQAVGGYIQNAMQAAEQVPEIAPLALELMMFAVRAFPAAKSIEGAFEQFEQSMRANMEQQDPNAAAQAQQQAQQEAMQAEMQMKQAEMQQDMQIEQMKLQIQQQTDQARIQADVQIKQAQAQMQAQLESERAQRQIEVDQNRAQMQMQQDALIEQQKMEFERWKVELQEATKIQIAGMASAAKGVIQIDPATETATNEIATEIRQDV